MKMLGQRIEFFRVMLALAALIWTGGVVEASQQVNAPEPSSFGQHEERVEDMRVKVLGGYVRVLRTFDGNEWHINRRWALITELAQEPSLVGVSYGSGGTGTVTAVDSDYSGPPGLERAGAIYIHTGNGVYMDVSDNRYTITRTETATGATYRWQDRKGHWIQYGEDRRPTSYGDRDNVTVTFNYNAEGKRSGVVDHLGNQILWYEYNADGRISAIRDYTERRVEYTYTDGKLTQVKDVRGKLWGYTYEGEHLKTKTDPEQHSTTIEYATNGTVSAIVHPDNTRTEYRYEYDKTKREFYQQVKEPGGKVTETWFDRIGDTIRRDVNGRTVLTVVKDGRSRIHTDGRGHKTAYEYDEWNNLTKITFADGTTRSTTYDPAFSDVLKHVKENGAITTYAYAAEPAGRKVLVTEAQGTAAERATEYSYDSLGRLIQVKYLADAATAEAATVYGDFDDYGNPRTVTDAEGAVHRYTYNVLGKTLTRVDSRGETWAQTYDLDGRLLTFTDPLHHTHTYEYDGVGNLKKYIGPAPSNYETVYGYDALDRLLTITDAAGGVTKVDRDETGRMVRLTDPSGRIVSQQSYDSEGNIIELKDAAGNSITYDWGLGASEGDGIVPGLLSAIHYPSYTAYYAYDNRDRLTGITEEFDGTTRSTAFSYEYADIPTSITDAKSRAEIYDYDEIGRQTKIRDRANGVTTRIYDDRNNLLSVTNARDVVIRRYEYDRNNRVTKEIRPDDSFYEFSYDDATGVTTQLDGKGQRTLYLHDAAGRLAVTKYYANAAATTSIKTVTFSYDEMDRITGYDDGNTSAAFTYDALGRKTKETVHYGDFSLSYSYGYDKAGRKTSFTGPDNVTVSYTYDSAGRPATIGLPGVGTFSYSSFKWQLPTKLTLPGGGSREWAYDGLMRPSQISGKDPAGNPVLDYGYGYDAVDNILSKSTEHGDYSYSYDAIDRLLNADNPTLADEAYTYDAVGNRKSDAKTTGEWNYADTDELDAYNGIALTYDDNGSLIEKNDNGTITKYLYNLENRLVEVRDGADALIARYDYDPLGRRLWKEVGGVRTYFFYSDEGLVAEANSTGTLTRQYGWKPDGAWGTDPLYLKTGGNTYFYQNDHLGTPQKLVSTTGVVVWSAKYEAFGDVGVEIDQVENPLRFPGQYSDEETELYYNYFRTYDPRVGRYLESDPTGLQGGLNTYTYALGNPILRVDPEGKFALLPWLIAITVVKIAWEVYKYNKYVNCVKSCDNVPCPDGDARARHQCKVRCAQGYKPAGKGGAARGPNYGPAPSPGG